MSPKKNKLEIYHIHKREIDRNKKYQSIVQDIIGDMIMYKVYANEKDEICLRTLGSNVIKLIKEWSLFAEYLSKFERVPLTVYRGVKFMNPNINHTQPIPCSSCLDFNNALDWIIPKNDRSFVMSIYVSQQIKYTFTGNMNEGNEVILPAGYLSFQKKVRYKNTFIVYYIYYFI